MNGFNVSKSLLKSAASLFAQSDPASLDNLNDLVAPDRPGYFPLANGWIVLLVLIVLAVLLFSIHWYRSWKSNAYRRQALFELAELQSGYRQDADGERLVLELNRLVKRVALVSWPRPQVAGMFGDSWLGFLLKSNEGNKLDGRQVTHLSDAIYSLRIRSEISDQQLEQLLVIARDWISHHSPESLSTAMDLGGSP